VADENNQSGANLEQTTDEESLNESGEATASDNELANRLASIEAQFERSEAEKETLKESLRLHQQFLERSQPQQQKQKLSDELEELDKTINPLMSRTVQESVAPIVGTVSKLYDQTDAVSFQLALQREDPELLKDFDRISAVVESVRQKAAREQGSWVSRDDAYKYAKGAGLLKPKAAKAGAKPVGEGKRKNEIAAAQAASGGSESRRNTGAISTEIMKIREKAGRGERLTAEERAKFKGALENVIF